MEPDDHPDYNYKDALINDLNSNLRWDAAFGGNTSPNIILPSGGTGDSFKNNYTNTIKRNKAGIDSWSWAYAESNAPVTTVSDEIVNELISESEKLADEVRSKNFHITETVIETCIKIISLFSEKIENLKINKTTMELTCGFESSTIQKLEHTIIRHHLIKGAMQSVLEAATAARDFPEFSMIIKKEFTNAVNTATMSMTPLEQRKLMYEALVDLTLRESKLEQKET